MDKLMALGAAAFGTVVIVWAIAMFGALVVELFTMLIDYLRSLF